MDLWSLGCILAEMLLGKPLFPGSSTINQLERILQYLPPPTRTDIDAVKSDLGLQVLAKIQIKCAARQPAPHSRLLRLTFATLYSTSDDA